MQAAKMEAERDNLRREVAADNRVMTDMHAEIRVLRAALREVKGYVNSQAGLAIIDRALEQSE